MPTIDIVGPYRVFFTSHDKGEPPHVHVRRDRTVAKIWLESLQFARNSGFSRIELNEVLRIVSDNQQRYLEKWHEYFD